MSSPSINSEEFTGIQSGKELIATVRKQIAEPLRIVAFWGAIMLPFLYVPLLATGLDTVAQTVVFLALLVLNLITLVIGHSHSPG